MIMFFFVKIKEKKPPRILKLSTTETMMKKREIPKKLLHLATVQQKAVSNFIEFIVTRLRYILHKSKII